MKTISAKARNVGIQTSGRFRSDSPERFAVFGLSGLWTERVNIFTSEPQKNQFFYGQPETETQYNEIIEEKKLTAMLQESIHDYNKSNMQEQISVVIFDVIIEKTLKINRSI